MFATSQRDVVPETYLFRKIVQVDRFPSLATTFDSCTTTTKWGLHLNHVDLESECRRTMSCISPKGSTAEDLNTKSPPHVLNMFLPLMMSHPIKSEAIIRAGFTTLVWSFTGTSHCYAASFSPTVAQLSSLESASTIDDTKEAGASVDQHCKSADYDIIYRSAHPIMTHGVTYVLCRFKPNQKLVARNRIWEILVGMFHAAILSRLILDLLKPIRDYEFDFSSHLNGSLAFGRRID